MMKKTLAFAAVVLLAGAATVSAQSETALQPPKDLILPAEACRSITAYQPGADGDAAYKPGVDVTGKPVVEADIDSGGIKAPDVVEFNLTVDVAQYLGVQQQVVEGQVGLGTISVHPDGKVLLNGAPMQSEAEVALRALCEQEKPADSGLKPDFQN